MNTALAPGIPGDDIPTTPEEDELFKQLSAPKMHIPPPITGYRVLSQIEVDLMNKIKAHGETTKDLILVVQGHLHMQRRDAAQLPTKELDAELKRIDSAEGARWAAIARTHFQEGLMALTRAVAQPSSF